MKTKNLIRCLIVLILCGCSQEDFLENANKQNLTDETQWASESNADIFLNDCYSEIPLKWNFAENLDYYSDDYNISHYYTASNWRGGITAVPTQSTDNVWGGTHGPIYGYTWSSFFVKIRKCNTFIEKIGRAHV